MTALKRLTSICLLLTLFAACGPAAAPSGRGAEGARSTEGSAPSGPKRLLAAAPSQPLAFYERVARAVAQGPYRGGVDLEWLVNSALTVVDDKGVLRGQLAEDAPTVENGLWKLFPDGSMETTWRIREGAQW